LRDGLSEEKRKRKLRDGLSKEKCKRDKWTWIK
jgi:hypothetical protein